MQFSRAQVEGNYLRDILSQPRALEDTVAGLSAAPGLMGVGHFDRIVVTGMGGSYHALYPLLMRLVEHGFQAIAVETAELIHYYAASLTPRTLLILVSQSGRSVEIVRLLDMAAGRMPTIGVTNTLGSPLARARITWS